MIKDSTTLIKDAIDRAPFPEDVDNDVFYVPIYNGEPTVLIEKTFLPDKYESPEITIVVLRKKVFRGMKMGWEFERFE